MAKEINKIIRLYEKHYHDLLELNKSFINTMRRPSLPSATPAIMPLIKRKLTKKQLKALEDGRKILASKRGKFNQI